MPEESCTRAKSLLTAMSLQNDAEAIWSVATVNIILSEALHHKAHPHHHHCAPWDHHIVPQWAGGQSGIFRGPLLTMITIIIVPLIPSPSNGCWPKWIFAFRGPSCPVELPTRDSSLSLPCPASHKDLPLAIFLPLFLLLLLFLLFLLFFNIILIS